MAIRADEDQVQGGWSRSWSLGPGLTARLVVTSRDQGDFAVDSEPEGLEKRRRGVVDRPWAWLRQVHGSTTVVLASADATGRVADPLSAVSEVSGHEADALVTDRADVAVAVQTADCGPLLLASREGVVAAVHAGWKGLEDGIVASAVQEARALGAGELRALLGPCIHPGSYRFGEEDLDRLVARFGSSVRSSTADGHPALDLPAAVQAALAEVGVAPAEVIEVDTAGDPVRCHSHRVRADRGRHSAVVWLEREG